MSNEETADVKLNKEKQLRCEVETLLSLESFAKHRDLLDQMDDDGYIHLNTILSSPSIVELSASLEEIQGAIKSSDKLQLSSDESSVRLIIPVERKTLILREVPKEATESEIRALLPEQSIVQMRQEVDSIWFLVFDSESSALQALHRLQSATLHSQPLKARVKSEFYKKELQRRLDSLAPPRKLSADAAPFEVPRGSPSLNRAAEPFLMPELTLRWGIVGLPNGTDFGYYYQPSVSSVPVVITTPTSHGYAGEFVQYPREALYAIVQKCVDVSLPAVSEEVWGLGVMNEEANVELVERGRTESIDDALRGRAPRTMSVDSVDYTEMVRGAMGEEVAENVRKHRRHGKRKAK